jgi:hypothetical protein
VKEDRKAALERARAEARRTLGTDATDAAVERDRFFAAIQQLDVLEIYSGKTYWDLQEDTHKAAHIAGADVHGGPAFLGYHPSYTACLLIVSDLDCADIDDSKKLTRVVGTTRTGSTVTGTASDASDRPPSSMSVGIAERSRRCYASKRLWEKSPTYLG